MILLRRLLLIVFVLLVVLVLVAYQMVRASLPKLDGDLMLSGLISTVQIERDELGVATISADNRVDAAFATGFLHGQERFFQMDLQRRAGAGELAALFGPAALKIDRTNRLHRFRHRAAQIIADMSDSEAALYAAYTAGVNTGLDALGARPFEYFLLQQEPEPWRDADILLTVFSMYFELNDNNASRDSELGALKALLHGDVYDWLIQAGTAWDAPLIGDATPAVPIPGPAALDLRKVAADLFQQTRVTEKDRPVYGSNNWAVSAARSGTGRALVAGDMHLGHAVPNIWYRARLIVKDADLDISGVTLPGAPLMITGSNGHVAWALTNSYGDWQDLIELEIDAENPNRYRSTTGWREFENVVEKILVSGDQTELLEIRETVWGPVIDQDFRGRTRAIRWLPHLPDATNAGIIAFEQARNVDQAIDAANRVGGPPQNYVVADAEGQIGWTIMGRIPRREGYDPAFPASWVNDAGWTGWLEPADYPRIINPPDGLIWTANARTVDGEWLATLGQGNLALGARAGQIRDGLRQRARLDVDDMLAIQLDDRALFLQRWQSLLLDLLSPDAIRGHPQRAEFRQLVETWGEQAAIDSAGYRLVRAFRLETIASSVAALLVETKDQLPDFTLYSHGQLERPVWQLIQQQPAHLLAPQYQNWNQYLLAMIDQTIDHFIGLGGELADHTWGERNTTRVVHPISYGLPVLSRWLNMPALPLPGDSNMPRVQGPAFGASQRMAVSPGNESAGYFHMPGGQSGHPLSPFYGSSHDDWAAGTPTPFLPGPPTHRLFLLPDSGLAANTDVN